MKNNNYILPDGNVQISFSGGRTSAYMLYKILEANDGLPDRAKVLFANTGREMTETLDFVQECSDRWNVNITWLEYDLIDNKPNYREVSHNSASRNGEPFEKLIKKKRYLPNPTARFCTSELKINTMRRYLRNPLDLGWNKWTATIGIRADESSRIKDSNDKMFDLWYPLNGDKVDKNQIHSFWAKQSFKLNLTIGNKTSPKGNCDLCFLKSEKILAQMIKEYPEKVTWWQEMEKEIGLPFVKGRDLTDFQKFVEAQHDWVFDQQGYFCQADGGECTG